MFTLTKEFRFEAAHSLPHLPEGHKCRRPHGHSYRVELMLRAEDTDPNGFAGGVDYADMSRGFGAVIDGLDHRNLNDVLYGPTTAENVALFLYRAAAVLWPDNALAVRVYETPTTCVEYTR